VINILNSINFTGDYTLNLIVREKPRLEEAAAFLKSSINGKLLSIVIGECRVDYEGRAASRLEPGERVVIVKQDGAVLVHGPIGYSPINWQPSTSVIEVYYRDDTGLVIHAVRDKPREYLTITFNRVDLLVSGKLFDPGSFIMYVDEGEMRDVIVSNPSIIEEGLRVLSIEKPVGDGYVDIYAVDKSGRHVVIELKRITATREAALQLYKYVEALARELGERPRGILVAPAFSPTALETLLKLGLEYRYVDLKKIWELLKRRETDKTTLLKFTRAESSG
jgi:RecB family endonuclease NucS